MQEMRERWANQPPQNPKGVVSQTWAAQRHYIPSDRIRELSSKHKLPITVITGTNDYLVHPSGSHKLVRVCLIAV
jgi:alpha-beta hydrolase superfamily lysophospholipase